MEKKTENRRTEYYKKSADCAGRHKSALFCGKVINIPVSPNCNLKPHSEIRKIPEWGFKIEKCSEKGVKQIEIRVVSVFLFYNMIQCRSERCVRERRKLWFMN